MKKSIFLVSLLSFTMYAQEGNEQPQKSHGYLYTLADMGMKVLSWMGDAHPQATAFANKDIISQAHEEISSPCDFVVVPLGNNYIVVDMRDKKNENK